jgi:hypothetical protein
MIVNKTQSPIANLKPQYIFISVPRDITLMLFVVRQMIPPAIANAISLHSEHDGLLCLIPHLGIPLKRLCCELSLP